MRYIQNYWDRASKIMYGQPLSRKLSGLGFHASERVYEEIADKATELYNSREDVEFTVYVECNPDDYSWEIGVSSLAEVADLFRKYKDDPFYFPRYIPKVSQSIQHEESFPTQSPDFDEDEAVHGWL